MLTTFLVNDNMCLFIMTKKLVKMQMKHVSILEMLCLAAGVAELQTEVQRKGKRYITEEKDGKIRKGIRN